MNHTKKIAILMTCHNRKEKTVSCLTSLYNLILNDNYKFQNSLSIKSIFMVLNTTEAPVFANWRWPFGGKTSNNNKKEQKKQKRKRAQ